MKHLTPEMNSFVALASNRSDSAIANILNEVRSFEFKMEALVSTCHSRKKKSTLRDQTQ